jgi:chitodextrinase
MSWIKEKAKRLRAKIETLAEVMDDTDALDYEDLFAAWKDAKEYSVGERVRYGQKLYKCLQAHTSQPDWTPDVAVSLWVDVANPGEEWPEWRQPTGAHDAYEKGAKVSHTDKHWVSNIDANIWEPGAVGTENLWRESL